jgi:hypothetical protein
MINSILHTVAMLSILSTCLRVFRNQAWVAGWSLKTRYANRTVRAFTVHFLDKRGFNCIYYTRNY